MLGMPNQELIIAAIWFPFVNFVKVAAITLKLPVKSTMLYIYMEPQIIKSTNIVVQSPFAVPDSENVNSASKRKDT